MPGLLALDHVHISWRIEIAASGASGRGCLNPLFAPEVGLADVVIIWDGDGGPVSHDIAELHPELEPAGGVLGVVVGLIAGEEEDIGIVVEEIFYNEGPSSGGAG